MTQWTTSDMPSQKGRSAVITGTGGLGLEDALALARTGGEVIIAGRNPQKGAEALARIRSEVPSANVRFEQVDLARLQSIADFAARLKEQRKSLELLINNAAVMTPPDRQATPDGFERRSEANQWGVSSIAAHPGISRTDLLHNAPGRWSGPSMARTFMWFLFQPAAQGTLPTLFAATSPEAKAGAYYGPDKMKEVRGFPTLAQVPPRAEDRTAAERLWRVSEELTRVAFH